MYSMNDEIIHITLHYKQYDEFSREFLNNVKNFRRIVTLKLS